ncbi:cyclopropane fatty acyl phospholipid synthase [Fodinibius salsisoli]|uniref:Cyclopropane fatty acyl phospholipid synthase n=1 Tax=Fodinibius salsisoli TaxID=2820877 RepID=A0ABT3PRF7_9BACT|nr:cyclopropane fatty acyl phospholipid synthase [Fodinibius salsisoli]MCW9708426.1 cyclopropane fatty acyl phospholipid synthase [Fodinibius salsisoli]
MKKLKQKVQDYLAIADIQIDGDRPWDMQVYNDHLYDRILREGSIGLGEAYMDRWWNAEALDTFFCHILKARLDQRTSRLWQRIWLLIASTLQNRQSKKRACQVGRHHYDTGNDLFKAMLDKRMVYTCGYWLEGAQTLEEAQEKKLDMVCRRLELEPGDRVLDIGCGWGSFAQYAAQEYEAEVVGITISKEQMEWAKQRCEGLPVEIRLQDYRSIDEPFDHVVSLGMFEHVGVKNYRTYMQTVARCLSRGGTFVLHTIGGNRSVRNTDPWIEKYIFPNSMIPSVHQIGRAIGELFVLQEWQNFGDHYDRTLMAWHDNFQQHWAELKQRYSNRFYRMWTYYLMCSAGSFRAGKNHQWHIVLQRK